MEIRRFIIANDHAGIKIKEKLIQYLANEYQIIDLGTNDESKSVNYSEYALYAVKQAMKLKCECILICGTGIGMCIAANKIKGARAANLYNVEVAKLAKQHNDANVICFGAREFSYSEIKKMLDAFIGTKFEGGRHKKRLDIISQYEKQSSKKIKNK